MDAVAVVRMSGPLTRHVEGFAAELRSQGYTELSLANQLRLVSHLSRWLQSLRILVEDIDDAVLQRFLAKRRREHTHFTSKRALAPLVAYLRGIGAVSTAAPAVQRSGVLLEYERYIVEERDVTAGVRDRYLAVADEFLRGRKRLSSLSTGELTRYIDTHAGRPGFVGWLSALRSLLRFLFVASKTATNLVCAVPQWSQRSLPKDLTPDELVGVLAATRNEIIGPARRLAIWIRTRRMGRAVERAQPGASRRAM